MHAVTAVETARAADRRWSAAVAVVAATLAGGAAAAQSARAPSPPPRETCVDIEIAGQRSYNCLNDQMRRSLERAQLGPASGPAPAQIAVPLDPHAPAPSLGIVTTPALRQQYGGNFGVSVVPYRPPPPVYGAPLSPR